MIGNFIFGICLIISFILFIYADKKNSKKLLILGIVIISVLSGFRGVDVGFDTAYYYKAFIYDFPVSWQFKEEGFRIVSRFLIKFLQHPTWLFVLFASITNYLIIARLWELRKNHNFMVMVLLYFLIYFLNTMNIMRQFICVAVIFYSTKLLEKKKNLPFIIIVLLCTQIHKSAILALGIMAIYYFRGFSKKNKIIFGIPCLAVFLVVVKYIINFESAEINNYLGNNNTIDNFNYTFMYRVIVYIFSYLLFKSKMRFVVSSNKKNYIKAEQNKEYFSNTIIVYGVGLIFGSLGLFFNHAARIGLYCMIFEIPYWGFLTKKDKNKNLNLLLIMVYAIYVFASELTLNGSQIFPYYVNFI